MISFSKFLKERQFPQAVAVVLLLLLLAMGALPGYLTGRWQWQQPPPVTTLKQLKNLRQVGLTLPGWQSVEQREEQIGGRKWSYQVIKKENSQNQAIVLLLPQNGPKDQPQVEWSEMKGFWQWQVAQERLSEFTVKQPQKSGSNTQKVKVRFFRAVTRNQTFAVLQWYASSNGGDPSPFAWFVADQSAQWHKQRVPWVAVNILIPMEPLGQVETTWSQAQSLGQTVQAALMTSSL